MNPLPLAWGAKDLQTRGPVLASRQPASLGCRNAIGSVRFFGSTEVDADSQGTQRLVQHLSSTRGCYGDSRCAPQARLHQHSSSIRHCLSALLGRPRPHRVFGPMGPLSPNCFQDSESSAPATMLKIGNRQGTGHQANHLLHPSAHQDARTRRGRPTGCPGG